MRDGVSYEYRAPERSPDVTAGGGAGVLPAGARAQDFRFPPVSSLPPIPPSGKKGRTGEGRVENKRSWEEEGKEENRGGGWRWEVKEGREAAQE